jgi:TDG/mug DNA glycosylase family protein
VPTRSELEAADGNEIPDLIRPGLRVLLVGINPGRRSGYAGFHFAYTGNRLWRALYESGLTPRLLRFDETAELRDLGIGITNLVLRTTAGAVGLQRREYEEGVAILKDKVQRYQPKVVAILAKGGYEHGFGVKLREYGLQPEAFAGRPLWVFPNPSPRNPMSVEFHAAWYAKMRESLG